MSKLFALLFFSSLIVAPVFGQTKQEKKQLKAEQEEADFQVNKTLIESKDYEFRAEWANPFRRGRISLVTTPNYLILEEGEARIHLPYFGVAHNSSPAYSGDTGIVFEGTYEDYKVEVNDKKKEITVRFKCMAKKENLDFNLLVYPSGNSRLNVTSTMRDGINYDGKTASIEKKE